MKKLILPIVCLCFLVTIGCKNEKNNEESTSEEKTIVEETPKYTVKSASTTVKWTAYKTTEKVPVSGKFTTLKFNEKEGKTVIEALDGLLFSISVSSIFSDNEERDNKLKKSFFGAMLSPELLAGKIYFDENNNCFATIKMNNIKHDLPLEFKIENDKNVTLNGIMNLEDWNALEAIESLNKVCFDLHKGEDGISKTWNDVAVEITTTLSVN